MTQQIKDFSDEVEELASCLMTMPANAWTAATGFKDWTPEDVVQHLHHSDLMAMASADGVEAFAAFRADMQAMRDRGMTNVEATRVRLGNPQGLQLLELWRRTALVLCERLSLLAPETRMPWAGPGMGLRMFATARQMETWSHGQAIYDLLGMERPAASPRLRNIAEIGVRTFGWTFKNRTQEPPGPQPEVRLETPFGEPWVWIGEGGFVVGGVIQFCQVVTQTRNVADTQLRVEGEAAREWMALAQCFAGPPEMPPKPGARVQSVRRWGG
ncbi:MAG: maleylpyruvate isomerase family mycothiol-dependent enzyme [Alphaproteobacteria bacterium]|nr:maleylpyruvate isomerase family mycothiol-dependent enzyme [Alphaproteobacteria bacterium]